MKQFLIIAVAIVIAGGMYCMHVYNKAVGLDEGTQAMWSQVLNQYERRADLIPNLVSTVKGYATHETDLLAEITAKRAEVGQIHVTIDDLSDVEKVQAFQKAQSELGGALSRLLAVSENYPDLKANQNFMMLQSQLEGTENRIAVARRDYIDAIRRYNFFIKSIPAKWILFDLFAESFKPKVEYTIEEQKKVVPQVSFDK